MSWIACVTSTPSTKTIGSVKTDGGPASSASSGPAVAAVRVMAV
jgi:hypothetical protein